MAGGATPRLTVVVSPREAHRMAEASLRQFLADQAEPFDLVYLDILCPPDVAAAVAALCDAHGGRVVRHNGWIAPAEARRLALRDVTTPFVAFIDNDVFVEPGCMARLLACAEETGAGLVGPLYLQGEHGEAVHMAGGRLVRDAAGAIVDDEYVLGFRPTAEADGLTRGPTEFVEWHCLLLRTDLARAGDVIGDAGLLTREHIHVSLAAAEQGAAVWLEPAARVRFGHYTAPCVGDLAFFRRRWDPADCEASLAAFCARWPVAEPRQFLTGIRSFLAHKRRQSHALAADRPAPDSAEAMAPAQLAQTRTALCEQALARGYGEDDVAALEGVCDYATLISDGLYRGDGRPFVNHLIGTASVLTRYGFRLDVLTAGLLQAALSHRPAWIEPDEARRVLGSSGDAAAIVAGLPGARSALASGGEAAPIAFLDGCALAVAAAGEVERLLSGERRACGAVSAISSAGAALLGEVMAALEAPGLACSALADPGAGARGAVLGRPLGSGSFRLDARARRWTDQADT